MSRRVAVVVWSSILLLVTIMLVFAGIRVVVDTPRILAGEIPVGEYGEMYARYPILAYLHIVPGVILIAGALFQLSRRFRNRHLRFHRAFGKWMLGAGLVSGIFALGFGVPFAPGFWLGLSMHAIAAELWLWWRPGANGRPRAHAALKAAKP